MVMAILYMENNLTADAFTPERLEILQHYLRPGGYFAPECAAL